MSKLFLSFLLERFFCPPNPNFLSLAVLLILRFPSWRPPLLNLDGFTLKICFKHLFSNSPTHFFIGGITLHPLCILQHFLQLPFHPLFVLFGSIQQFLLLFALFFFPSALNFCGKFALLPQPIKLIYIWTKFIKTCVHFLVFPSVSALPIVSSVHGPFDHHFLPFQQSNRMAEWSEHSLRPAWAEQFGLNSWLACNWKF